MAVVHLVDDELDLAKHAAVHRCVEVDAQKGVEEASDFSRTSSDVPAPRYSTCTSGQRRIPASGQSIVGRGPEPEP